MGLPPGASQNMALCEQGTKKIISIVGLNLSNRQIKQTRHSIMLPCNYLPQKTPGSLAIQGPLVANSQRW
jgi:hypothetical protein